MSPHTADGAPGLTPGAPSPTPSRRRLAELVRAQGIGEYVFVAFTIALGVTSIVGALSIGLSGSADTFGPRSFPLLVGILLIGSGAFVLLDLIRGRRGQADDGEDIDLSTATDWAVVAKLVGLIILHSVLIPIVGWWLAAALLFWGAAWSLGAKKLVRAALIALALGMTLQIVFGVGLGLSLPPGPLLDWIPFFRG